MHKFILFLVAVFLSMTLSAQSELIDVPSSIEEVTVFQSGAEITRSAKIDLPAGTSEFVLSGLSKSLVADSWQIDLGSGIELLSITKKNNFLIAEKKSAEMKVVEDSTRIVEREKRELEARMAVLQGEEQVITKNMQINEKSAVVISAELNSLADLYRKRMTEIKMAMLDLGDELRQKNELYNRLKQQLNIHRGANRKSVSELVLLVDADRPVNKELSFSYLISAAGWSPHYHLRSPGVGEAISLKYLAKVSQNSGFDWEDVKLKVSSAVPNADNNRPILGPVFADYQQVYFYKEESKNYGGALFNMATKSKDNATGRVSNDGMAEMDQSGDDIDGMIGNCWDTNGNGRNDPAEDRNGDGIFNMLDCQGAAVQRTEMATEFEIPDRRSIESATRVSSIELTTYELPAEYSYHTVPKLQSKAFLVAKVPEWGKYNLLTGSANLFFEDSFIGKSTINSQATSDTLWLSLGRDESIKVNRKRITELTENRFIGINRKETYAFETEILNTKSQAIEINVLDQIPLTKQQDIEIKLIDKDGAEYLKEYGKISWDLKLKAGESKKVKLVYSLKYPKTKTIHLKHEGGG